MTIEMQTEEDKCTVPRDHSLSGLALPGRSGWYPEAMTFGSRVEG